MVPSGATMERTDGIRAILRGGKVRRYAWEHGGRRLSTWGYSIAVDRRQVRRQGWGSRAEAQEALDAFKAEQANPTPSAPPAMTFGEAVARYLVAKARKRTIGGDRSHLSRFKAAFGADTPVAEVTAAKISAWRDERQAAICPRTKAHYTAGAVNRPLAALRHLLQLAHEEWGVLVSVPKVKLLREPQGRIRWLEPDEEARLLAACAKSRSPELAAIVTVALETGMRRGELLGLEWDRVDLSRGVLRLEVTKSGRRREVPMRQAVYDTLAHLPGEREGRVFRTRSVRTAFESAVREAKVDAFVFHDCRHHFASWFVMRGGKIQELQQILGHASLAMTMRYAHLSPAHLRSAMLETEKPKQESRETAERTGVVDSRVLSS
jgi:integrase